jgi:hypothetical protein
LVAVNRAEDYFSTFLHWLTHADEIRVGTMEQILSEDPELADEVERSVARRREAQLNSPAYPASDDEVLRRSAFNLITGSRVIPPERHKRFEGRMTPALRDLRDHTDRATRHELYQVLANMIANVIKAPFAMPDQTIDGHAREWMVAHRDPTETHKIDGSFDVARGASMPLGHSGVAFDRARLRTTNIMTRLASEVAMESSIELYRSAPHMFEREAARVRALLRWNPVEVGLVSTLQEGIISLNQLITLMLGAGIEGVSSDKAMRLFLKPRSDGRDLVTDLSIRHPMGLIGPAALAGWQYRNALRFDGRDLVLTEDFKARLGRERYAQLTRKLTPPRGTGYTGHGCPAGRGDGLRNLARAYLHVFRVVREVPERP